ncbi:tetratricopeptide repeat protein [Mariniflexile aquimaris]|uniref:Tetratricopeptide repeat protein n=1 Tax=Mariniflexile aquimaris TaxID=881009 RepID=A0ABW3BXD5_9FLAO
MNKTLLILILIFSVISCNKNEKSKELTKQAMVVFTDYNLDNKTRIDSSLTLLNLAIELDKNNFKAYENKYGLLSQKKDIDGMFSCINKMVELRPNQPYWKLTKGFVYDLKKDSVNAFKLYTESVNQYKNLLKTDSSDFNLTLEFAGALKLVNENKSADSVLKQMQLDYKSEHQMQILDYYIKNDTLTRKEVIENWKNYTIE